ncbi:MAG: histidine kinase, partial [Anaerolineae bacterium]|nr:histidine kinase [Anaerolineae bacterium]
PDFQGSGLGLTIVQGDVMNLGGEIALRSQPDEGTTITVSLPIEAPIEAT